MAQCNYHPEAKGSATCPTCHKHICDKCRMRGTAERCMTCHSTHSKGGAEAGRAKREMCTNHDTTPADMRCVRCKKIHCPACLNGAMKCFRCALKPEPGQEGKGTGSLKGKGGTGSLKGKGGTGALNRPAIPFWRREGVSQIIGGVAVLAACGVALKFAVPAMGLDLPGFGGKPAKPFTGAAKVEFAAPAAGRTLAGNQVIKLKVASADHVERVEVTVDGKYWERLKEPPFESEWQTQIFRNGSHTIVAKAYYEGGKKTATAVRKVKTKNKN